MTTKDNLKSARKKFMVMRVKNSVMQMMNVSDEEVDSKLGELLNPLMKTFGEKEGQEILDEAILSADEQFTASIRQAIVEATRTEMEKK